MVDDDKDEILDVKPFTYFEQSVVHKIHHFYLSEAIGEASEYVELIHRIKVSGASEIIHIHLNTPGGSLGTGVQLINAMQTSEAHIICSLEAEAYSLGTLIFLAADEFLVHDNCMMMIHNYTGGVWGKGHEQIAQLTATTEWFNKLAKKLYIPFLSKAELDKIISGEDLWLQSDDIRKRLVKMVKVLESEQKENAKKAAEKVVAKTKKKGKK